MKQATGGKAPVIDVTQFGYYGVLGAGAKLTHPVIVKARSFSKLAEKKIKNANGACMLVQ